MGMPEAGAMAALLGGTATYSAVEPGLNNQVFNENPDDPAAEQRRFNFFDYAADGQLNGSITMNELKMLSRILLPAPDAYTITDRQRASANGFLLDPTAQRNFVALQHILPEYEWVPKSAVKKYKNISPMKFGVNKGIQPGFTFPLYTLFDATPASATPAKASTVVSATRSAVIGGVTVTVDWLSNDPSAPTPTVTTATAATTPTTAPSTLTPAGTVTPVSSASTTSGTTSPTTTPTTGTSTPATVLGTAQPNPDLVGIVSPPATTTTGGTTTAPVTAPTTASSTASSTPASSAATPPAQAAVSTKTPVATKSTSTSQTINTFFTNIGNSLKKFFT
jgi:hypothetical protein